VPWARFDDSYDTNPKILAAGRDGKDLHSASIRWSARELTDGFIPESAIAIVAGMAGVPDLAAALERCLTAVGPSGKGLLERIAGGYQVHDYLNYQPSAAKVRADREENARRQAEWRRNRRSNSVMEPPVTPLLTDCPVNPNPVPDPQDDSHTPTPSHDPRARPGRHQEPALDRDPLFVAVVEATGIQPATRRERADYATAINELRDIRAGPDDVRKRAETYRARWPDKPLTAKALISNWTLLGQPAQGGSNGTTSQADLVTLAQREHQTADRKRELLGDIVIPPRPV
jgi:hypothetical protein